MNMDKLNPENLTNFSRADVRELLGLAPRFRDYVFPAIGLVSAGLVIGAGTALLLAPKSGAKLRADISDEFRSRLSAIEDRLSSLGSNKDDEIEVDETEAKAA